MGGGGQGGEGRAPAKVEKGTKAKRVLGGAESGSLAVAIGSSIGSWVGGALLSAGGDKSDKGDAGDKEKDGKEEGNEEGTQAVTETFEEEVVAEILKSNLLTVS
jgi:hypothetical protein